MPRFIINLDVEAKDLDQAASLAKRLRKGIQHKGYAVHGHGVSEPDAGDGSIVVFTDGGCWSNGSAHAVGAWAFRAEGVSVGIIERAAAFTGTTNNRMEMMAVIAALERLEIGPPITIFADSQYVIKGCTEWSRGWVRRGWTNAQGEPVKNRDLWERMLKLYQLHNCKFRHVKGHSGVAGNERVDELCSIAMTNAHKALLAGEHVQVDPGCPTRHET